MSVPDYQTVELLDRVRRADEIPEKDVEKIHCRVFDESGGIEETEVRRELRQKLKPSLAGADEIESGKRRKAEMAAILKLARGLRRAMADSRAGLVPGGLRERLEQALVELEGLD